MKDPIKRMFFDIEISPCTGWFWRTGKQVVTHKQLLTHNKIICLSWEEEHSKKGGNLVWDNNQDDKALVEEFQEIASGYDVVIGQNSDSFDIRHVAARLAYHASKPLHISISEDTYRQCKRRLALPAYSLDYLGKYFGVGRKIKTDSSLWEQIVFEDRQDKLPLLIKYCRQDVKLDKAVWQRVYPYVDHKVNYGIINDDRGACPHCGSNDIIRRGYSYTRAGKKAKYQCNSCYRYSTKGHNEIKKGGEILR